MLRLLPHSLSTLEANTFGGLYIGEEVVGHLSLRGKVQLKGGSLFSFQLFFPLQSFPSSLKVCSYIILRRPFLPHSPLLLHKNSNGT